MNMSDDSTMSPVQALKALWQKHAGVPEEGTEDAGRWEVLRRAAAAQGEGVAFDEWVLEQEARLDERGMLIDIRNAERRQAAASTPVMQYAQDSSTIHAEQGTSPPAQAKLCLLRQPEIHTVHPATACETNCASDDNLRAKLCL